MFKNSTTQSIVTEVVIYTAIIGGVYVGTKAYKGMKRKFAARKAA